MFEIITDNGPVLTFNTFNDIFHIFLGLKQLQQILLAVIEHHDFIADIFFQEK